MIAYCRNIVISIFFVKNDFTVTVKKHKDISVEIKIISKIMFNAHLRQTIFQKKFLILLSLILFKFIKNFEEKKQDTIIPYFLYYLTFNLLINILKQI